MDAAARDLLDAIQEALDVPWSASMDPELVTCEEGEGNPDG